jgi:hypothetical protein
MVGVSTEPRVVASRFKMVDSSRSCLGTKVCNLVASKYPCWSSLYLNGGGGGSSVTAAGQEAFMTDGAWDPPLCENIQDVLRYSKCSKVTHTKKKPLRDKTRNH